MQETAIDRCGEYAEEFLRRLWAMKKRFKRDGFAQITGCKEAAALRRISLDLTRALADLRQGRE
uniref:Uncharacterized protein n=1 Tax=viral metagenome TaxID=1070528 RepID=A0A6H1Z7V8_9ZZZZ